MKNYLQRNKYSEVSITEYRHGHHDEMKTNTEYRKRKRRIAHDEDKQTEEIELRKLRKSSNTDMTSTQHSNEEMKELRK